MTRSKLLFPTFCRDYERWMPDDENKHNTVMRLREYFSDAKIFIMPKIDRSSDDTRDYSTSNADKKYEFSLPFKNCFFETAGAPLVNLYAKDKDGVGMVLYSVVTLLVAEFSPTSFLCMGIGMSGSGKDMVVSTFAVWAMTNFIIPPSSKGKDNLDRRQIADAHYFSSILQSLCARISASSFGTESYNRNVPLGAHKSSGTTRINEIIRLRPKTSKAPLAPVWSREIDWSHRWWVRGHWRRLHAETAIGKDRTGSPEVKGYTWVTEHTKGPDDKGIVDKIRLVT